MDWDKVTVELKKKLDPKHIKPPAPGKYGDYLEGFHVISEANRIFGEGNWSYTITRLSMVSEQTVDGKNGPQYRVGYMASVLVEVGGVKREGAALGSGVGKVDAIADHHESAIKEAETDALKRALRTFGSPFGLALYDKTRSEVGEDPKPIATRLLNGVRKSETDEAYRKVVDHKLFKDSLVWLDSAAPDLAENIREEMKKKAAELFGQKAA